ncbi:hypothetical protein AMTR_s03073p00001720 [Amborella trichopoda]|uniref:TAZ-type domain-containing protein n=1 Tax=Amborella trichopoda TaxID=13333 RepID=U5CKL6_AMBTC|nr:hypothetical protein AMTR_s03073p00001720 [Amborella trichopoda]
MAKSCESSMLSCRAGRLKLRNAKIHSSHSRCRPVSKDCIGSDQSRPQTQAIENLTNQDWIHIEWSVILHHGSKCSALENQRAYYDCVNVRRIWMHISSCQSVHCHVTLCQPLRKLWGHYCHCSEDASFVCFGTHVITFEQKPSLNQPSNSGKADLIRSRAEAMSSELLGDVQHPLKRMRVEQPESAMPTFINEDCTNEVQYPISEVCVLGKAKTGVQIKEPGFVDVGMFPTFLSCESREQTGKWYGAHFSGER